MVKPWGLSPACCLWAHSVAQSCLTLCDPVDCSPRFRAEQGTSLETPSRARASSCQAVGTTWFFSSCGGKTWVQSLGWEDPLEKGMATYSNILA